MARRKKVSSKLKAIFKFYKESYEAGLLNFAGSDVRNNYTFEIGTKTPIICFKEFENGGKTFECSDVETLQNVIIAKKSWGLHLKMWSKGSGEGTLIPTDITKDFKNKNIKIPEQLLKDFDNKVLGNFLKSPLENL